MQWALDLESRDRILASPNVNGICPGCSEKLIPKCGSIVVHHWAHHANRDCDPWWEPESEWHRGWKALVHHEATEVTIRKGEIYHRADIVGDRNQVIELQHSAISGEEIREREIFYKNMVWVFDVKDSHTRFEDLFQLDIRWDIRALYREKGHSGVLEWKRPKAFIHQTTNPLYLDFGGFLRVRTEKDGVNTYTTHGKTGPYLFRVLRVDDLTRLVGYWLTKDEFLGRHARSVCVKPEEVVNEYQRLYGLIQTFKERRKEANERRERCEREERRLREGNEKKRQLWLTHFAESSSGELAELLWRSRKEDILTPLEREALLNWDSEIFLAFRRDIIRKALKWSQDRWHKFHVYLRDKAPGLRSFKESQILAIAPNINAARKGLNKVYEDAHLCATEWVSKKWPCDICLPHSFPSCRRGPSLLDCYNAADFGHNTIHQDRSGKTYYRYRVGAFGGAHYFYEVTSDGQEMKKLRDKIVINYLPYTKQIDCMFAEIQKKEAQQVDDSGLCPAGSTINGRCYF